MKPNKEAYQKKAISGLCATQTASKLHHHDPRSTDEVKQVYLSNNWTVSEGWCHEPNKTFSHYEKYFQTSPNYNCNVAPDGDIDLTADWDWARAIPNEDFTTQQLMAAMRNHIVTKFRLTASQLPLNIKDATENLEDAK